MRRFPRVLRAVAGLALITTAACSTWSAYSPPLPGDAELPTKVRFTLQSGESIKLTRPQLEGDSVYVGEVSPRRTARVPVSAVAYMEAAHFSAGRTALAVVGLVGVTAGFLILGACSTSDFC